MAKVQRRTGNNPILVHCRQENNIQAKVSESFSDLVRATNFIVPKKYFMIPHSNMLNSIYLLDSIYLHAVAVITGYCIVYYNHA